MKITMSRRTMQLNLIFQAITVLTFLFGLLNHSLIGLGLILGSCYTIGSFIDYMIAILGAKYE